RRRRTNHCEAEIFFDSNRSWHALCRILYDGASQAGDGPARRSAQPVEGFYREPFNQSIVTENGSHLSGGRVVGSPHPLAPGNEPVIPERIRIRRPLQPPRE